MLRLGQRLLGSPQRFVIALQCLLGRFKVTGRSIQRLAFGFQRLAQLGQLFKTRGGLLLRLGQRLLGTLQRLLALGQLGGQRCVGLAVLGGPLLSLCTLAHQLLLQFMIEFFQ